MGVTPPDRVVDKERADAGVTKVKSVKEVCKEKGGTQPPFLLGDGLAPAPAKLVEKIQRLEFVDMADLLRDNLEVKRWSVDLEPTQASRNRRRDIPDLFSFALEHMQLY